MRLRVILATEKGFESGELKEKDLRNANETYFGIYMDNCKTLKLREYQELKYVDFSSSGEGMTRL